MIKFNFSTTLVLTSLVMLFMFSSCKKEDETPPTPSNSFTVSSFSADLTKGNIEEYGDNGNGSYDWDVTLLSDGIDLESESGVGSAVYLDLNSDSETGLTAGTYNWAADRDVFTLVDAAAAINYDIESEVGDYINDTATGGTVIISFSGDDTVIDFELTMSDGEEVKGYYKGTLQAE